MRPGRQLNVLLTDVPVREESKQFLHALSLASCCLSLLAPTIVIGDLNTAPTDDNHTGPTTATRIAVRDAMHHLGLSSLTAGLTGTPSHYPHQASTNSSRIKMCYGDLTTVHVHEATYGDLPPACTGHGPHYIDLIIPILPPPSATMPDETLPPTLQFQPEDNHSAWHKYTGPCKLSSVAPTDQHSPLPCDRQRKHAAWNATTTAREHRQTFHFNRSCAMCNQSVLFYHTDSPKGSSAGMMWSACDCDWICTYFSYLAWHAEQAASKFANVRKANKGNGTQKTLLTLCMKMQMLHVRLMNNNMIMKVVPTG